MEICSFFSYTTHNFCLKKSVVSVITLVALSSLAIGILNFSGVFSFTLAGHSIATGLIGSGLLFLMMLAIFLKAKANVPKRAFQEEKIQNNEIYSNELKLSQKNSDLTYQLLDLIKMISNDLEPTSFPILEFELDDLLNRKFFDSFNQTPLISGTIDEVPFFALKTVLKENFKVYQIFQIHHQKLVIKNLYLFFDGTKELKITQVFSLSPGERIIYDKETGFSWGNKKFTFLIKNCGHTFEAKELSSELETKHFSKCQHPQCGSQILDDEKKLLSLLASINP